MDNTIQPSGLRNVKFGYRLDNGLPVDNTIGLQSGLQSLTLDDGGAGSASASASASASDGAAAAQPQQQQHQQHQQQQQQQQKQRQPRRKWNEADFKIEHRKWTFVGDRPVRDPPPGNGVAHDRPPCVWRMVLRTFSSKARGGGPSNTGSMQQSPGGPTIESFAISIAEQVRAERTPGVSQFSEQCDTAERPQSFTFGDSFNFRLDNADDIAERTSELQIWRQFQSKP